MKNVLSKRNIIIAVSLYLMLFFRFLPTPAGMTGDGMQVLGIFFASLLLWIFISIDWPSLLCILALSLVPSLSMKGLLANSLGNNTFAFLLFSFMCTYALSKTTLIRRIAVGFVTSKLAQKGPWQFSILFFSAIIFIGCFISPTVLFVVSLPILEEIYQLFKLEKGDKFASMLMMGLVCCSGISSGMTPIGHVYGPLAIGFYQAATGNTINYVSYMGFAIPVGIVTVALMLLLFRFILRPKVEHIQCTNVESLRIREPLEKRELGILLTFILVVLLWVLPSLLETWFPAFAAFLSAKTSAFPPLLGVVVLCIFTMDKKPLMDFNDSIKNGVSWPALIMCAGTLALGAAMTNEDVALTSYLTDIISPVTSGLAPYLLVVVFILWAAFQTNLSSNIVSITVVSNIAIPILLSTGGAVSTPAVVAMVGMIGGYAFATPPAMPSVAIAGGTGWVPPVRMMGYGFAVMVISVTVSVLLGYPIAVSLLGY